MTMPKFEEKRVRLKAAYQAVLKENGLDGISMPEHTARKNFNAMYEAGWFLPATKQQAWEAFQKSRASAQPRGYDQLLDWLSAEVEEAIRMRGGVLTSPVYVRSYPIGYANACAMAADGGTLVLLSSGLISLIYQVSKIFLYSYDWLRGISAETQTLMTLSEVKGWETYGWTRERTVEALSDLFASYFRQGDPSSAERQGVPKLDGRAATLSRLVHYAEHFVVAHEFAHVLLEHTGPVATYATPLGPLRDVYERRRQQEIDADELAVSLQLATADMTGKTDDGRLDANIRIGGIILFFACTLMDDVIREGAGGFTMDPHPYSTHPSANDRMRRVFGHVERYGEEFRVLASIVLEWVLPLSIDVAKLFHLRCQQSGEVFPYLAGRYMPFQSPS